MKSDCSPTVKTLAELVVHVGPYRVAEPGRQLTAVSENIAPLEGEEQAPAASQNVAICHPDRYSIAVFPHSELLFF